VHDQCLFIDSITARTGSRCRKALNNHEYWASMDAGPGRVQADAANRVRKDMIRASRRRTDAHIARRRLGLTEEQPS
jgi:hypothetical protein